MQGSTSFLEGYHDGRYCVDRTGWPIDEPPTEKTVVEFIFTAGQIVQDKSIEAENLAWLAGLSIGQPVRSTQ